VFASHSQHTSSDYFCRAVSFANSGVVSGNASLRMFCHFFVFAVQSMMIDCVVVQQNAMDAPQHWEAFEWVMRLSGIKLKEGTKEVSLRRRIEAVSLFARLLVFREECVLCLAHCVAIEWRDEIEEMGVDVEEQKRFAERMGGRLLLELLGSCRKRSGLLRAVKRLRMEMRAEGVLNMYRMTALILWRVYRIRCPFPM